jgi:hypothetical protein
MQDQTELRRLLILPEVSHVRMRPSGNERSSEPPDSKLKCNLIPNDPSSLKMVAPQRVFNFAVMMNRRAFDS